LIALITGDSSESFIILKKTVESLRAAGNTTGFLQVVSIASSGTVIGGAFGAMMNKGIDSEITVTMPMIVKDRPFIIKV